MSRMNSRARKKIYPFLVKRDGDQCNKCGVSGKIKKLVIDHVDNNNNHNPADGSNWQLLCRRHNVLKNPKGSKTLTTPTVNAFSQYDMPATMRKNISIEFKAKQWMYDTITADARILKQEVIQRLAFVTDASVITLERWIQKSVVNEEPECRYCATPDEQGNIWIELKKGRNG